MQSHQVAVEKRNQEVFVGPVVGRPASSSSDVLKHSLISAEAPAVILLEDRRRQMLRNSIWFSFLVVLPLCLLYDFSSGLLWGDGWWLCSPGAGRDGVLCFVVSSPAVFPVTFSHTVFVAAKCFPKRPKVRLKYLLRSPQNGLVYPLCPVPHILKTVRISWSSKSRHCTTVKSLSVNYSNVNVTIPPLLIAYCTHLQTTVRAPPLWNTHTNTHTRLSLICVSLVVMTAVHNIPKQYLSFFSFIICKMVMI